MAKKTTIDMAAVNRGIKQGLPNHQLSKDESDWENNFDTWKQDVVEGFEDKTLVELQKVGRALSMANPDVRGSINDLEAIYNTKTSWHFPTTDNQKLEKQARDIIEPFLNTFYPGGLAAFSANQYFESYNGESSVEWVPRADKSGINHAVVVLPETLRYKRTKKGEIKWYQDFGFQNSGNRKYLNNLTYHNIPLNPNGRSVRGTSVIWAALEPIWRKERLMKGEDRIIHALQNLAFVLLNFTDKPSDEELGIPADCSDADRASKRQSAITNWAAEIVKNVASGSANGLTALPFGVEGTALNATTNMTGIDLIIHPNNLRIITTLYSATFMRGIMDSTTQALAKIVYPIILAYAKKIGNMVDRQIEFGVNLHLQLSGLPIKAVLVREPSPHPFKLDYATAAMHEAKTNEINFQLFGEQLRKKAFEERNLSYEPQKLDSTTSDKNVGNERSGRSEFKKL